MGTGASREDSIVMYCVVVVLVMNCIRALTVSRWMYGECVIVAIRCEEPRTVSRPRCYPPRGLSVGLL